MRIVFVSLPLSGAAREAGYEVEFVTGAQKVDLLAARGFFARGLRGIGSDSLESIANTAERVGSNPVLLLRQFRENLTCYRRFGRS